MKKCLLVSGGAVSAPLLKKIFYRDEFAYVFAVDRGLEALDACGIRPTHLVGDFDSVRPEVLEKYLLGNTAVERLIPEKDDTDTEHAMRQAVRLHPDEILLMGGFGSRFDHVLANLHTLTIPLRAGIPACMLDGTNRVRLLGRDTLCSVDTTAEFCIKKRDAWGNYVSLIPLTAEVTGITLEGFKYSLSNADFKIGETVSLGVSNELEAEEGIIRVKEGILVVAESADQPIR